MLLEVGRVARAHGLHGEVVVHLVTNRHERMAPGSVLRSGDRNLVVSRAQELPGNRGATSYWLVRFAGVTDRSSAEALRGALLQAGPLPQQDGLWVHELIGAEVVAKTGGSRGRVVAVEANPASDLLVLESGALVPLCFVVATAPGRVEVEVPEGLFEL